MPLTLDFRRIELRRLAGFIVATTFINIAIASQLSYGAVNYMDSVKFCGETCHTVMQPEFTAYQNSPHSRVECVNAISVPAPAGSCAASSRASVRCSRSPFTPTRTPFPRRCITCARRARPAKPATGPKFGDDRLRVISKFADDEKNTPTKTVLLMKIGGGNGIGIHGVHVGPGVTIRYASDESRQTIPWVSYQKGSNAPTVYAAEGFKPDKLRTLTTRVMDCMDCHNRPSHTFQCDRRCDTDSSSRAGTSGRAYVSVRSNG